MQFLKKEYNIIYRPTIFDRSKILFIVFLLQNHIIFIVGFIEVFLVGESKTI